MTQLINQPSSAPSRKVKAAGVGGVLLGVPVAQPLATVTIAALKATMPGLHDTLVSVSGFQSGVASLYAVLVAAGIAYFTRDRV